MMKTDVKRLIHARTSLDYEFQQHVRSSTVKWSMMGDKFNDGFVVSTDKLAPGAKHGEGDMSFQ